jgi:hypothetical protein
METASNIEVVPGDVSDAPDDVAVWLSGFQGVLLPVSASATMPVLIDGLTGDR